MPKIRYEVEGDSSGFKRGMAEAQSQLTGFTNDFAAKMGGAGDLLKSMGPAGLAAAAGIGAVATAAAVAAKTVADMVAKLAQHADNLDALSAKTSVSVGALQKWELAAKLGNTSTDALAGAMVKMQKAMADTPKEFDRLGLSVQDLKRMAPEQQFEEVTRALVGLEDRTEMVSIGAKVMGKSFTDNLAAMQALTSSASDLGGVLDDETAKAAADLQDQLDTLGVATDRFTEQLAGIIVRTPGLVDGIGEIAQGIGSMGQFISDNRTQFDIFLNFLTSATTIGRSAASALLLLRGAAGWIDMAAIATGGPGEAPAVNRRLKLDKVFAGGVGLDQGHQGPSGTEALALLTKGLSGDVSRAKHEMHDFERAAKKAAAAVQTMRTGPNRGFLLNEQMGAAPPGVAELPTGWNFGALLGQQMGARPAAIVHPISDAFKAGMRDAFSQAPAILIDALRYGGGLGAAGGALGGAIGQSLQKPIADGLQASLGKTLSGALGSLAPGIGGLVGGLAGNLIGGLFHSEEKDVNKKRQAYVDAGGGLDAVNKKAAAAGMTLDALLSAKKITDFNAAVAGLGSAFDRLGNAKAEQRAAMEEFGLGFSKATAEAGELYKKQQLLLEGGFSMTEVNTAMAARWSEYVQDVIASGEAIPAALKPTLDQLGGMNLLVDENGKAFDEATLKGLSFTDQLSDQFSSLLDEIHDLILALRGLPAEVDVNVRAGEGGGGRVHGGDGEGFERFGARGGYVDEPTVTLLGERGPEVAVPLDDPPAWAQGMMGGGAQQISGRLQIDLRTGLGELVAQTIENNTGGARSAVRRAVLDQVSRG